MVAQREPVARLRDLRALAPPSPGLNAHALALALAVLSRGARGGGLLGLDPLRLAQRMVQHLGAHALVADHLVARLVPEAEADLARRAAPAVDGVPHRAAREQLAQQRRLAPLSRVVQARPAERLVLEPRGRVALEQTRDVGQAALLRRRQQRVRELQRLVRKLHLHRHAGRRQLRHDRVRDHVWGQRAQARERERTARGAHQPCCFVVL